jgi:hypothetical protein
MAVPLIPVIISVGGVLIRTTAKQLPAMIRRFKGAKPVKNPTQSQVDAANRLTKDYTNFSKKSQKTLGKADTANPSFLQRLTGRGRTPTQKDMKPNPSSTTGEAKRAKTVNRVIGGTVGVAGGIGVGVAAYKNQLAKARANLKKAKTAEMKAKERANVEKLLRKLQQAESKKASSMPRTKPKRRPGS